MARADFDSSTSSPGVPLDLLCMVMAVGLTPLVYPF